MWGRTAAISCFFFFFFFWAGVGLLKYKTETSRTQVHVPFANNFIIAKCIIGSLHFFFIIFFFKVCTQNIKSASDQRSHRVGQCTSDQKSAGGGGACMTQGDRADRDKNVCFCCKSYSKMWCHGTSILHRTAKHVRAPENRNMKNWFIEHPAGGTNLWDYTARLAVLTQIYDWYNSHEKWHF